MRCAFPPYGPARNVVSGKAPPRNVIARWTAASASTLPRPNQGLQPSTNVPLSKGEIGETSQDVSES